MPTMASQKRQEQQQHSRPPFAAKLFRRWRGGGSGERVGAEAGASGMVYASPKSQTTGPPGTSNHGWAHREESVPSSGYSAPPKQPPRRLSPFPGGGSARRLASLSSSPLHLLGEGSSEREAMTEPRRASGYGEPALSPVLSSSVSFSEGSYKASLVGEGSCSPAAREPGRRQYPRSYSCGGLERQPPSFSSHKSPGNAAASTAGSATNDAWAGRVASELRNGTLRSRGGGTGGGVGVGGLRGGVRRGHSTEGAAIEPRIPVEAFEEAGGNFAVFLAIRWRHRNGEREGFGDENGFEMLVRIAERYGLYFVLTSFSHCRPELGGTARRRQPSSGERQSHGLSRGSRFRTIRHGSGWWATGG